VGRSGVACCTYIFSGCTHRQGIAATNKVPHDQRGPKEVAGLRIGLGQHLADASELRHCASEHGHRPGAAVARQGLQRSANGKVGEAVGVEKAGIQGLTEGIALLGVGLAEHLPAAVGEAVLVAVEHHHRTSVCARGQVLEGGADGQISEAVGVEVALGHRGPEQVTRLRIALHDGLVRADQAALAAVDDVDRTSIQRPTRVLPRRANGQVVESIAVEVDPLAGVSP
jgi:hypothetical protein